MRTRAPSSQTSTRLSSFRSNQARSAHCRRSPVARSASTKLCAPLPSSCRRRVNSVRTARSATKEGCFMRGSRLGALSLAIFVVFAIAATPALATKYVSLGDSYSSGTGTRTYYTSTCQRSVYSYPYLVHNAHPTWTFVHAACSGAKTGDVLNTQASSVTSDTNWITYTIGGNDAGFSSVITTCAQPSWLSNCDGAINTAQSYITNTLPAQLNDVNIWRMI